MNKEDMNKLINELAELKTEPRKEKDYQLVNMNKEDINKLINELTELKTEPKKEKDYQLVNAYFKVLNYSPKYKKYLIQINENYTTWIGKNYIKPQVVQITLNKNADLYLYDNKGNKVVIDLKKVDLDKLKDLK